MLLIWSERKKKSRFLYLHVKILKHSFHANTLILYLTVVFLLFPNTSSFLYTAVAALALLWLACATWKISFFLCETGKKFFTSTQHARFSNGVIFNVNWEFSCICRIFPSYLFIVEILL